MSYVYLGINTGPHILIFTICRPGVHKGRGKVINPLEQELRKVVKWPVCWKPKSAPLQQQ